LKRKPKNGDRLEALSYAQDDLSCGQYSRTWEYNCQSCGQDDLSCGQDDRTCGQDDRTCGRDDQSCGRDDQSCGRDDQSCGRDDLSCGQDDLSPEEVRLCKKLSYFVAFLKYKLSSQNFY
jgi:hypothetical protein